MDTRTAILILIATYFILFLLLSLRRTIGRMRRDLPTSESELRNRRDTKRKAA